MPGTRRPLGQERAPRRLVKPDPIPVDDNARRVTSAVPGRVAKQKQARRRILKVRPASVGEAEKTEIVEKWLEIMRALGPEQSDTCERLETASAEDRKLYVQALFSGSPDTLRRNLGAINFYRAWAVSENRAPFPFTQHNVIAYATFLVRSGAPPTRAETFQSAGKFTTGKMGLVTPIASFQDGLFNSLVDLSLAGKSNMVKEAVPYPVIAVAALERAVYCTSLPRPLRIIAGAARFCIGARLRHGDASRFQIEPVVLPHKAFIEDKGHAFIETTATITKTSQTRQRMKRPIPVAAHAWGVATEGWAAIWLKLRQEAGLDAHKDETLMPACGPDLRFVAKVRMATDALCVFVKTILRAMEVPDKIIRTITAHSMKVTFLSWCGKAGLEEEPRRKLGGHSRKGESMVDPYSRDLLSEPLRQLGHVLLWVRHRDFQPDKDRASRWTTGMGNTRVDLTVLQGVAGGPASFDPKAPLKASPLLLRHTAMPVEGRDAKGNKVWDVRDRVEVRGAEAPDSGHWPEQAWWSNRAPPTLGDPTSDLECDSEDEQLEVEDPRMKMLGLTAAGIAPDLLRKDRPPAADDRSGGDMARKRPGKATRVARQKVLTQAAAPRPLADEVNKRLRQGAKRNKSSEAAKPATKTIRPKSSQAKTPHKEVKAGKAAPKPESNSSTSADTTAAEAMPLPTSGSQSGAASTIVLTSPPAWCAHWTSSVVSVLRPNIGGPPRCFVPPNLFGLRYVPTGTRHWGSSSEISLRAHLARPKLLSANFGRDDSGQGTMCGSCVENAIEDYSVPNAEDYVDGVVT